MAHKYLGSAFDIHGGGVDLTFPHHENEIAQAKGFGDDFATYWVHNAWVTMSGEKMSKSLGNSVLVSEMVKHWRPIVLRYYLASPHYRSTIEYSDESLREADAAFGRIEGFLQRAGETVGDVRPADEVPAAFAEAMDDDFAVPQALAVVHNTVRQGNAAMGEDDKDATARAFADVRAMLGILGLDPLDSRWQSSATDAGRGGELRDVVDSLVRLVLDQRQAARQRKDYATADAIRDELKQAGLVIEDTPSGPRWELGGSGGH
jgi:cysteinyl-tRNA synthetase